MRISRLHAAIPVLLTGVDHPRYGDPTYISPTTTRLMVIDTRTGERAWVHGEPAQLRGFAWSPDGDRLAYFAVAGGEYRLRIFDAATGAEVLVGLRPDGWAGEARAAFVALTEAPVIVQDSRNDLLAWDRVRNIAARQITALVSPENGSVREILSDVTPSGTRFSADGSYITYSTATRTKTSYTRRDGTEYELFRLALAEGSEPESLRDTDEQRMNVTWNEARDAFAYGERGSVFVRRLDEDEAVDVTEGHRGDPPAGDAEAEDDPEADSARIRFSVQRWSPSGDRLLLASRDAWHTRSAHDREELFQEITVRLWERRAQYSARGELGGWINRIAHRFCYDWVKAQGALEAAAERHATEVLAPDDAGAVLEDPSILMERKDFMDDLRLALAQLPEKQEETFTLIHVKGYGTAEVARMLGTRRATVRSNLRHAIRKLREFMKEYSL